MEKTSYLVTKEDIIKGLKEVGFRTGDIIMVHSSLSSIGYVEGGADTVIDAFLEIIDKEGTLVMPAFSFGWDSAKGQMIKYPFNIFKSPSRMGKITETFRLMKETLRSNHPTHSVIAKGSKAKEITLNGQYYKSTVGKDSPFEKMIHLGAYILLLGVNQTSNTTIHHIEDEVKDKVPYLKAARIDGEDYSRAHSDFNGIEKYLIKYKAIKFGKIGEAIVRVMNAKKLVKITKNVLLKEDPCALLCENLECKFCCWARQKNAKSKLSGSY